MQYRCPCRKSWKIILNSGEAEAERAAIIIEEEIKSILNRFIYLGTRPVMVSLSEKAEQIRQRELRRAMGKLPDLKEEERRVIEHMTHMLVRKNAP